MAPMFTVPDAAKDATHCPHNFSCLETAKCGERPLCEVEYAVPENILFLTAKAPATCPYRWTFGAGKQVCKCPVRYAIYKLYKR